ncbi:hypothetical protein HAX54_025085 [Datura stramonium]|uniref:Uncharacterized protein n=1 Tax=Datura stramonium TaxID=4076 RepID=A0ABS8V1H4_DATST|nr:hypothetical protein [Datura stramonium]
MSRRPRQTEVNIQNSDINGNLKDLLDIVCFNGPALQMAPTSKNPINGLEVTGVSRLPMEVSPFTHSGLNHFVSGLQNQGK